MLKRTKNHGMAEARKRTIVARTVRMLHGIRKLLKREEEETWAMLLIIS